MNDVYLNSLLVLLYMFSQARAGKKSHLSYQRVRSTLVPANLSTTISSPLGSKCAHTFSALGTVV